MLHAGVMGGPCSEKADCQEVDLYSHCDAEDRVCVCDDGHHPTEDRRRCVAPRPSEEIAIITVCVVVIGLLIFVNAFLIVWVCKAFVCLKSGQRRPADLPELFGVMGCNCK